MLERHLNHGGFPKFVEFQTHSYCNSRCLYCPFGTANKEFSDGMMEEALFKKIVDECSRYKLKRIIPYLDNEPFMDARYIDKLTYIREKMPDVFIEIATNVELLTGDKAEALFDLGVNEIRMSIHGLYKETYHTLMKGLDYDRVYENVDSLLRVREKKGSKKTRVVVVVLKAKTIGSEERARIREFWKSKGVELWEFGVVNRAGNMDDTHGQFEEHQEKKEVAGCFMRRPLERFHILYNGDVICCDHDWKRENVIGNITGSSICDVWNNNGYRCFREYSYAGKPSPEDFICKRCTYSYTKHSFMGVACRLLRI